MRNAATIIAASAIALLSGSWRIEPPQGDVAKLARMVREAETARDRPGLDPSELRRMVIAQGSVEPAGADVIRPTRSIRDDLTWFGIDIANLPDRLVAPMLERDAHVVVARNKGCICPTGIKGARNPTPVKRPPLSSTDMTIASFGTWTDNGVLGEPDGSRVFYVTDETADVRVRRRRMAGVVAAVQKRFGLDRSAEIIRDRHGDQFIANFSRVGSNDIAVESDAIDRVAVLNSNQDGGTMTLMVRTRPLRKREHPRTSPQDPTQTAFDAVTPTPAEESR